MPTLDSSYARLMLDLQEVRERTVTTPEWRRAPDGSPSLLNEFQWLLVRTQSFKRWFGDWEAASRFASQAMSPNGEPRVFYHGTKVDFESFENLPGHDAGLHFGTLAQASMRTFGQGSRLIPVFLNVRAPRRSKDKASWTPRSLSALSRAGLDGVVYLNRYEGVALDNVLRASAANLDVDRLSPDKFRQHFPEAEDSWIVLTNAQIRSAITGAAFEPTPSPSSDVRATPPSSSLSSLSARKPRRR